MSRKIWKPKVGDKVRLSRQGYRQIRVSSLEEAKAAVDGFTVVRVGRAYTEPECYNIDVDGPLSGYVLTALDLELIK